jgi:hypothetical protein
MERVARFLELQAEPVSQREIERSVEGKTAAVRRAVDVLVTDGFAERTTGARGALLHGSIKPFREVGS